MPIYCVPDRSELADRRTIDPMIILSKLADYGVIVATHLAAHPERQMNAAALAARDPAAARDGRQGAEGAGPCRHRHRRARRRRRLSPGARRRAISVAEVVAAIDGAIGMTQCSIHTADCERTTYLPDAAALAAINLAVGAALSAITLAEMVDALRASRRPVPRRDADRQRQPYPMSAPLDTLETVRSLTGEGYKYGFVTDIESDSAPPGLNEDTVRFISAKKGEPEWLLEWRLEAFRAWQKMEQPEWAKLNIAPIDYQAATYYSAPKQRTGRNRSTRSIPSC